jgi:hypothetical protein
MIVVGAVHGFENGDVDVREPGAVVCGERGMVHEFVEIEESSVALVGSRAARGRDVGRDG